MNEHFPTIDKCEGCNWNRDGYCIPYLEPLSKWRRGECPMATHLAKPEPTDKEKKRAGQQHQVKAVRLSTKQQQTYSRVKAPD